ncbi:hypothetical protein [Dysgonomonas sp. 25]|uniref:hypothetical protein n=1 Tax=Dysgonomonas sp. 25 TaxID=2302933 RepID=UPI0013D33715|nr:hypothetical protein [Dysgonomonas sp. 25]NDV70005.1 hypothetical protein [Dysgonomonas sp. 25]
MKKIIISLFVVICLIAIAFAIRNTLYNRSNKEPHIYHLQDVYNCTYYVYPEFRDEYSYIKYLFDFSNEHPGTLVIVGNENDVSFEDGIDYINESNRKNPYFFFSRPDSSALCYERIRVSFPQKKIDFRIITDSVNNIERKKIKADFENINVNILQNFFDYSSDIDYKSRKSNNYYIYELYNHSDILFFKQMYTDYGKYFTVKIY